MRILAIDLGTSSVKLMRMDEHARVLSVDRAPATDLSVEGWIRILNTNLTARGDAAELDGIAITGQMHGLMTVETGRGWGEGIPWHDDRSTSMIPEIQAAVGPEAVTTTGGPIAPGFLAASLAWVRKHDPERWRRIATVSLPKDALIRELTGEHVTDPGDAAGSGLFAPESGEWSWPVVDALGVPREWLPRILPSGSIAGRISPEYASLMGLPPDLPVIMAGGDAPVGAYGAGVTRDTDALVMLSTGAQVILPSRTWNSDRAGRWYTWPSVAPEDHGHARYLQVGTLLNAGNVTAWAESALADGEITSRPSGLVALPHLIGMREDPFQRGAIVGLTARTTASEIRTALIEGIAFSVRAKLDEMTADGKRPTRIRLGGGLTHRPDVRQRFANVLNVPVEPVSQPDLSAYGAGLLGLSTLTGLVPASVMEPGDMTTPQASDDYDAAYDLFCELHRALAPFARRISALRRGSP